ncbi:MAG: phosphohydrolase [Acidobacteria bacterium]|nr:MAG: phosphohydrolase [Acidobacteriota bacterium]
MNKTQGTAASYAFRIASFEENQREQVLSMACTLVSLLDLRDSYTGGHSNRVAEYNRGTAVTLGLSYSDTNNSVMAGLLHDIGKIGVPDHVLLKQGKLTDEEFELIKKHPEFGWMALKSVREFEEVSLMLLHHHERIDGGGYPGKLKGAQIPLGAKIIAVSDSYDALTTNRPYRTARSQGEALEELVRCRGTQFEPEVLDAFVKWIQSPAAAKSRIGQGSGVPQKY